jgi:ribosomal-protein-alanine N-acetyltransferase
MVELRRFSLSDLNQVLEIEKSSFPKRQIYSKSLFKNYYKEHPKGFIVAESEGEIIGYTIGKAKNEGGEIISLAIKPTWRQKGIGTKLTNFLINHFKEGAIREVSLNVRTKNKTGIAFYQKLGFKILEIVKNYYRNGDDAYLMKKGI